MTEDYQLSTLLCLRTNFFNNGLLNDCPVKNENRCTVPYAVHLLFVFGHGVKSAPGQVSMFTEKTTGPDKIRTRHPDILSKEILFIR